MVSITAEKRGKWRQKLVRHFNYDELRALCFDMGVDEEELPGQGKSGKAQELVSYLERRGRLQDLARKCFELRPNIFGDEFLWLLREKKREIHEALVADGSSADVERRRLTMDYQEITIEIRRVKSLLQASRIVPSDDPVDGDTPGAWPMEITRPYSVDDSISAQAPTNRAELCNMLLLYLRQVEAAVVDAEVEKLNWRPFPGVNSIYVLARHSIASTEQWVCGFVGGMRVKRDRDKEFMAVASDNRDLLNHIRSVERKVSQVFDNLDETQLGKVIVPAGMAIGQCTIMWCIVHAIEHIAYHLGELNVLKHFYDVQKSSGPRVA